MYEHKHQPLAPRSVYYKRLGKHFIIALMVIVVCLAIGTVGYHSSCDGISWLDCFHNSSMILSGMGPVISVNTSGGKWFSSFYALFSGIVFITNIGLILAPALHRFFHKLHLEQK